jgi:hypothetical protein
MIYNTILTAITPSSDRLSLFIFASTCSKLYFLNIRDPLPQQLLQLVMLTIPISCSSASRCCSKNDFSGAVCAAEDAVGGLLVLDDMLQDAVYGDALEHEELGFLG